MDMNLNGCETITAVEIEADSAIEIEVDNLIDGYADDIAASHEIDVDIVIKVLEAFKPVLIREVICPATFIICEKVQEMTEETAYHKAQANVRSDVDLPLEGVAFMDMETALAMLARGDTSGGMVYLDRALAACKIEHPIRRRYSTLDLSTGTLI